MNAMDIQQKVPFPLWENEIPLSAGTGEEDTPTMTLFIPPVWKANKKAIIIFPGGGYWHLCDHEGSAFAEFFSQQGFYCFVVKYRLGPKYHHPAEISDAARAVRLVRSLAPAFGIRQDCIGVMGSSAGGHLAASVSILPELGLIASDEKETVKISSRPDFAVLCYPVISGEKFAHQGSFQKLLGDNPDPELLKLLSLENSVNEKTPPIFLQHRLGDTLVPMENSIMLAQSLRKHNVPFELHIYEKGYHGGGLDNHHAWVDELLRWLSTF